jgi:hypothetical protein
MFLAMQLRFCITVSCDAKTAVVLFVYLFLTFKSCHYPIPIVDPDQTLRMHGGLADRFLR